MEKKVAVEAPTLVDGRGTPVVPSQLEPNKTEVRAATEHPDADIYELGAQGSQRRPWHRLLARSMDGVLVGCFAGFLVGEFYPQALTVHPLALGIILLPVVCIVESLLVSHHGTTPGKALLGIQLLNKDGSHMSYPAALRRNLRVWFFGLGMGIPVISLFTRASAFQTLTDEGVCSWDKDKAHVVVHKNIRIWRLILPGLIMLCPMILKIAGLITNAPS